MKLSIQLFVVTLLCQSTNLFVDWKNLRLYDRLTINSGTVRTGDNSQYSGIATNVLSARGFRAYVPEMSVQQGEPTYLRTPGSVFAYAVPLWLFARSDHYAITPSNEVNVWAFLCVFTLVMGALGTVYFHHVSALLLGNARIALLATVIYIVWPSNLVFLSPFFGFLAESFVVPLLLMVFYVLLAESRPTTNLLAGLAFGYCLLTRAYLVLFPLLFVPLSLLFRSQSAKRRVWIVTAVGVTMLVPWLARNYRAFGVVSLSSQGGEQLYIGNNPSARGSMDGVMWNTGPGAANNGLAFRQKYPVLMYLDQKHPGLLDMSNYTEVEASRIYQQEAIDWMRGNLTALPRLWLRKLAIAFYPSNFESGNRFNLLTAAVFLLFVPGFLLFVKRLWQRSEPIEHAILLVPVVCTCLVIAVFYADYRYRFPMEPFLVMFAAYGVAHRTELRALRFRRRR